MVKIAIIDPSSYSIPYDYFYIEELKKEFQVDFYFSSCSSNYEYIRKLEGQKNVMLCEYPISPSAVSKLSGIINYFRMLKDIWLKRGGYYKIHFIWSIFFFFESVLFLFIREKLIFTFHNDVPHSYKKKRYFPYRLISKLTSKSVFVSQYTMQRFIDSYGEEGNERLIQHGVMPIDDLTSSQMHSQVQKVESVIVFWGRVEEYKGVDLFLNSKLGHSIEIYGKWSPKLKLLKGELSKNENILIEDNYLPMVELAALLSRDVVFILPYKDATQSGVLYTLLAYGKVFISSDVGENKEFLIKHGLDKLIFDRENIDSVIRAIDYAIKEYSEIRAKLLVIKNEYEWCNVMMDKKIMELYG